MHSCLALAEIQLVICQLLANDRSSLLSLACTCSVLKEPALNRLWRKVSGLRALFKCLPWDIWGRDTMHGRLCFNRTLNDADIAIFDKYRHRVRILHLRIDFSGMKLIEVKNSGLYPGGPLLPNLLELKNLAVLTITVQSLTPAFIGLMHKFPTLISADTFHRLRVVFYNKQDISQLRSYSNSICTWRFVRDIGLSGITSEGFLHIAQMPYLEELSLGAQTRLEGIDLDFLSASNAFPRLRSFAAFSLPPHTTKILPYIPLSSLVEFSMVSYLDHREVPQQEWVAYMRTLGHRLNPRTLKKFSIAVALVPAPVDWQNVVLSHLLPFSALEKVRVNFGDAVSLSVQYASEIAKAWLQITHLDIGPHDQFIRSDLTPLSAFVPLANGCPRLQSLRLPVNAADTHVQADLLASLTNSTLGSPNLSLECLRVGWSPIVREEFVASFLLEIFPNLAYITATHGFKGGEEDLAYRNRWRKVGRILIPMLRMAKGRTGKSYPKVKEAADCTSMRLKSRWLRPFVPSGNVSDECSTESETSEEGFDSAL